MTITSFNPLIVTQDAEAVIALFEAMGFERRHMKTGINDKDITSVRMRYTGEDGKVFHVDVTSAPVPQDIATIRMNVRDMETLFPLVSNGTKVVISGGPYGPLNWGWRVLKEGDRGADVRQLQLRLVQRGLLWSADGVFGPSTRRAVIAARKELNLSPGDQADAALQERLGMILFE